MYFEFECLTAQAMKYMQELKAERSGKAVVTEVIDESASGMDDDVSCR